MPTSWKYLFFGFILKSRRFTLKINDALLDLVLCTDIQPDQHFNRQMKIQRNYLTYSSIQKLSSCDVMVNDLLPLLLCLLTAFSTSVYAQAIFSKHTHDKITHVHTKKAHTHTHTRVYAHI